MSHDQNFKNLILDYPRQALAFFAAEEAAAVDETARITPIRQEQLQERLGDRFRELDVPLLVEWPDGGREAILFVVEEESDGRRFSIHRLAHYCLDLAELFGVDRVVPVVVFLRGGVYPRELRLGGDRHSYLEFRYLVCELAALASERYWQSENLVARLNLPNMGYDTAQRVDVYAHAVRGLFDLEPDPERRLKYLDFVDTYAALDESELIEYRQRYPEEATVMSTFAERFREEGLQQGLQQGEAMMLLLQLERKYGSAALAAYRDRVEQADSETLLRWSERILTADSIDGVFEAS